MTKQEIIKQTITKDEFIETRKISDLTDKFTSGNVTTHDVYQVFKAHQPERVEWFFQELQSGLDITKTVDGEDITFDAGNYIEKAIEDGKSIMHCVKFLQLPTKSINQYLSYLGFETASNTTGQVKDLVDKLIVQRKQSRKIYYDFMSGKYGKVINKEKAIKKELTELLERTSNRKKLKQGGVNITAAKVYNKKTFTAQQLIDVLGDDKAKELFGIEPTKEWKYTISTSAFDKKFKQGDKDEETK